jgi:hypothetical protein
MRYTPEQLKEMATAFLGMKEAGVDIRCDIALQMLSHFFHLHPDKALDKIKQLAENGECA